MAMLNNQRLFLKATKTWIVSDVENGIKKGSPFLPELRTTRWKLQKRHGLR